jgi:hypothetical protein
LEQAILYGVKIGLAEVNVGTVYWSFVSDYIK